MTSDCPRVLHVVESWRPVPSGYAARSWWIVTGQADSGVSVPGVLVSSRQAVYPGNVDPVEEAGDIPIDVLQPSATEELLRNRLPGPLARPFHVDSQHLETEILEQARRHRADLLHVHWSSAIGQAAARAANRLGLPLIAEVRFDLAGAVAAQTFAGHRVPLIDNLRRHFERHLPDATRIVAASDALADLLRDRFPALASRLHVVPNGVDTGFVERCRQQAASAEPRSGRVVIGTTSKMLRYENLDALIEIARQRPELDVLLVGDGPERDRLSRLARPLNDARADRVRLVGRVPAESIPSWLSRIDLFVVPRHDLIITRYASPIKVVEAMAAGRAIIATAVGDTRTLLAEDHGRLVPPGDADALLQAVDELAAAPGRRAALGEAARRRIETDYAGPAIIARYASVYAKALATPRTG